MRNLGSFVGDFVINANDIVTKGSDYWEGYWLDQRTVRMVMSTIGKLLMSDESCEQDRGWIGHVVAHSGSSSILLGPSLNLVLIMTWCLKPEVFPIMRRNHVNEHWKDRRTQNGRIELSTGSDPNVLCAPNSDKGVLHEVCRRKYVAKIKCQGVLVSFSGARGFSDRWHIFRR